VTETGRARARDLGIVPGSLPPGQYNAITDVPGVRVAADALVSYMAAPRPGRLALVRRHGPHGL
jgi:D-aminopeptidase